MGNPVYAYTYLYVQLHVDMIWVMYLAMKVLEYYIFGVMTYFGNAGLEARFFWKVHLRSWSMNKWQSWFMHICRTIEIMEAMTLKIVSKLLWPLRLNWEEFMPSDARRCFWKQCRRQAGITKMPNVVFFAVAYVLMILIGHLCWYV